MKEGHEQFKITLKENFDEALVERVEDVFRSENLLQAVIHGHLLLERAITSLIGQKMKRPEILEDRSFGRLSFLQKLGLYVSLYDPPEHRQRMLFGFNRLRNEMTHQLELDDRVVAKFLPWDDHSPPRDARNHVWAITAILFFELNIVQKIERLESSEVPVLNGEFEADKTESARPRGGVSAEDRAKGPDSDIEYTNDEVLELHFMHPRSSKSLTADVSNQCSGEEALGNLMSDYGEGMFLAPLEPNEVYELSIHRTSQSIAPQMSFEEAGAIDGDWIDITIFNTGAGVAWSE